LDQSLVIISRWTGIITNYINIPSTDRELNSLMDRELSLII